MQEAINYKALYEGQLVQVELLKAELAQLKRIIFGSKTESFLPTLVPSQLALEIQSEVVAATSVIGARKIAYTRLQTETRPHSHPVRMKLPEHLERRETVYEPEALTADCRRIREERFYKWVKLRFNRFDNADPLDVLGEYRVECSKYWSDGENYRLYSGSINIEYH